MNEREGGLGDLKFERREKLSVVSCQLSVVGCRLSVVGCRLSRTVSRFL
ncbi:MAG: hypothetical protein RIT02_1939 [Planctomycetota bacterium]